MKSKNLLIALAFMMTSQLYATSIGANTPLCQTATLQTYLNNYGTGVSGGSCAIGQLAYAKFDWASFSVLANGNSTNHALITASDLNVIPVQAKNGFDIAPVAGKEGLFNRAIAANMAERYFLTYNADPPPIIAGDELSLDPPVGPVYASKWICADQPFSNLPGGVAINSYVPALSRAGYNSSTFTCGSSNTPAYFLTTDGDPATATGTTASITFPIAASYLNVRLLLDFEPGAEITGFDAIQSPVSTVPEPSTNALIAFGILGLGLLSKSRRKR